MPEKLAELFYQHKNAARAVHMAAYMKNNFPFLGIPKPDRTVLQRAFFTQAKKAAALDWTFVSRMWDLPEREFQYCAVDYLSAQAGLLEKSDVEKIAALIVRKSWWDTIDSLAANVVGVLCAKFPELIESHVLQWAASDNIWLVRVAILFQLKYKAHTNTELLSAIIAKNKGTKEFFINKAIGWALREYSKTNAAWVKAFLADVTLHPLSAREGGKYVR